MPFLANHGVEQRATIEVYYRGTVPFLANHGVEQRATIEGIL